MCNAFGFWGKQISARTASLKEFILLSLTWTDKNILKALHALKIVVFVCVNAAPRSEQKYFDSEKNHKPPPTFKFNGCSLILIKFFGPILISFVNAHLGILLVTLLTYTVFYFDYSQIVVLEQFVIFFPTIYANVKCIFLQMCCFRWIVCIQSHYCQSYSVIY